MAVALDGIEQQLPITLGVIDHFAGVAEHVVNTLVAEHVEETFSRLALVDFLDIHRLTLQRRTQDLVNARTITAVAGHAQVDRGVLHYLGQTDQALGVDIGGKARLILRTDHHADG